MMDGKIFFGSSDEERVIEWRSVIEIPFELVLIHREQQKLDVSRSDTHGSA